MNKYIIDENLGLDAFAERIIVRRKDSNKTCLLSKMELMDMTTTAVAYQEYLPLLKLSYEHVVSYFDIFTSIEHKISAAYINLLSDYYPMGNLDKYLENLRNDKTPLDNQLIDIWFAQILDGLMYLWSENIIHRNLKPDCIYLNNKNNEQHSSLIIAEMIPPSIAYDIRMRTRLPRRALSYTGPEIFETGKYSIQSDIYSFGCVIFDMITCDTLTNEETLQLRICARYDGNTLTETLENLRKTNEILPKLIGQMMLPNPQERLTEVDLQRDDYVIETMHKIDSNQMKYPSERDKKWTRDGLEKNEKNDYYIKYLKQHRNAESRTEHALQLLNNSKSTDFSTLATSFENDFIPIVEHFLSNSNVAQNTIELLNKIIQNDVLLTSKVATFVTKMMFIYKNDEHLIGEILQILIRFATRETKLLFNTKINLNLVEIIEKHENNAEISSKCCVLLWLLAKDSITSDFRQNQTSIFKSFLNILEKHPENNDLFTKVCFAFLPFIFEKSTFDLLAKFNLVRQLTIGLEKHIDDVDAIKSALTILSELFQLDERCAMRFLCSRSNDGNLIDSIENLNKIFNRYENRNDVARRILILFKSMINFDDAVDEMISKNIEENLLYQIKRFHSDENDVAELCENLTSRILKRN